MEEVQDHPEDKTVQNVKLNKTKRMMMQTKTILISSEWVG